MSAYVYGTAFNFAPTFEPYQTATCRVCAAAIALREHGWGHLAPQAIPAHGKPHKAVPARVVA
jgi:hypothetical protein